MMNTVDIWIEQMNELKEMCNALIAKEKAQKAVNRIIIMPNKFGYTKDINDINAREEARKAANKIIRPNKR